MTQACNLDHLLREKGLKSTKQRTLLLQILTEANSPLDAEQILEKMKMTMSGCNLSTVYRNMEIMLEKQMVVETRLGLKTYFALQQATHGHYIQCLSCKTMTLIEGCPFEQFEKQVESRSGYTLVSHKVELFGLCHSCRDKQ